MMNAHTYKGIHDVFATKYKILNTVMDRVASDIAVTYQTCTD